MARIVFRGGGGRRFRPGFRRGPIIVAGGGRRRFYRGGGFGLFGIIFLPLILILFIVFAIMYWS